MKAVFRVDASAAIGSGHLARCLTLARALASAGLEIDVLSRAPGEHTRRWVDREGHHLVALEPAEDADDRTCSRVADAALVVVDGYRFGASLHASLRGAGRVVCVIDDLASGPVGGDVVLNGNFFAASLRYEGVQRALLGPSYALVRDEFRRARRSDVPRGDRPRILVTMGGADPAGATELFLEALEQIAPADVRVIVGGANPRADAIREVAERVRGHRVQVLVDVARMSEQMAWSDVAVAAAGSTCLELACVGVPAVVVAVADNQVPVAESVTQRELMMSVGRIERLTARAFASAVQALLDDPSKRAAMEARQRQTVDGLGAQRAATELLAMVSAARAKTR